MWIPCKLVDEWIKRNMDSVGVYIYAADTCLVLTTLVNHLYGEV